MKKSVRITVLLAISVALLLAAIAFTACGSKNPVTNLRVENPRINFMRGDEFETGKDFAVFAEYKDGTEKNVTADVSIRQESGMDMNVPGNYQITVSYGDKKTIYTIYVNDAEDILRKISLDTAAVKKSYQLGDAVSFDGLVLDLTYENAQGVTFPVRSESLKNFTVSIENTDGVKIDDVFTALGAFTVTISQGNVKASYAVSVDGINISTVQGAVAVGGFYRNKVASGSAVMHSTNPAINKGNPYETNRYTFGYGKNYTYFTDTHPTPTQEYHCTVDSEGIFITYLEDGQITANGERHPDIIYGLPYNLWYLSEKEFGAENALANLYDHAKQCSNRDLTETADENARAYSFSFSGLELREHTYDYYETTVSFTLGADYHLASLRYEQDYYENNQALSEQPDYVPTFITDGVTGITRPNTVYSYRVAASVSQTAGERTATSKYNRDMFLISSYDLIYSGDALENNDVLSCSVAQKSVVLNMQNILPSTWSFTHDELLFDYVGNVSGPSSFISNEHFTVLCPENSSEIRITVRHGGKWTLVFKTKKTEKRLTLDVTGLAPTKMSPNIYNASIGEFYDAGEKTLAIGSTVYFFGAVDPYADATQTAQITSQNADSATVENAEQNGMACFAFRATQNGVYEITVTSDTAPSVYCTFTFTVSDMPDYTELFSGKYTVDDGVQYVYELEFTLSDEVLVAGTVKVTRTPTDDDGQPIAGETVQDTLSFALQDTEIEVDTQNKKLWIGLMIDEHNRLVFIDFHNKRYECVRVTEN